MNKQVWLSMLVVALAASSSLAIASSPAPHTWNSVSTTSGTWHTKLQMINEEATFVTRTGAPISAFTVTPGQIQEYGFVLGHDNDFNLAYAVTLTQQAESNASFFESKACVYVVTAFGPGQADIQTLSYHGAKCAWKANNQRGEDFIVS